MTKLLLNPGPTNTDAATRKAQDDWSDVCHRTPEFSALLTKVKKQLLRRFLPNALESQWEVALIGGSGTLAMEAAITSLLERCTVIVAGKYGARALEMMDTFAIPTRRINVNHASALRSHKEESGDLWFVEHETTTGERFDPMWVAEQFPKMRLFVDATSAFGATSYEGVAQQIDGICFCSNKVLQSTPGVGIVIWRSSRPLFKRSVYGSLANYTGEQIPFTLPTGPVGALAVALEKEPAAFNTRKQWLIQTFADMGIKCINEEPSSTIIGFEHPTMTYTDLQAFLNTREIIIYGPVPGIDRSFRVATMSSWFEKWQDKIKAAFKDSLRTSQLQ